jgi:hypothetical protein
MTGRPRFALLPIGVLKPHEEIIHEELSQLLEKIRADGRIDEPILVSSEGWVILNGHHRFEALRRLGARRVPAWVVEYGAPEISIDRWSPGPPISKEEVLERAQQGRPFPPKTTRHEVKLPLPKRPTPLSKLQESVDEAAPGPKRPSESPGSESRRKSHDAVPP